MAEIDAVQNHLRTHDKAHKEVEAAKKRYERTRQKILEGSSFKEVDSKQAKLLLKSYKDILQSLEKETAAVNECIVGVDTALAAFSTSEQPKTTKKRKRTATAHKLESEASEDDSGEDTSYHAEKGKTAQKQKRGTADRFEFFGPNVPPDDYVLPVGAEVAARISRREEWILASVVKVSTDKKRIEVADAEPGDGDVRHYTLKRNQIIPIPPRDPTHFTRAVEFPKQTIVVAMFPGTSCFYHATVIVGPRRRKNHDYVLKFKDDENEEGITPTRTVPPRYVLPLPEE